MAKTQIRWAYSEIFTGNEQAGCGRLIGLFWDNRGIGTCHNCRVMYCREHYNMRTQLCDICTRDPEEGRKWGDFYCREVLKQGPKKPRQSARGRSPSLPAGLLGVLMVLTGLVVLGHVLLATVVSVIFLGWFAVLGGLAGLVASLFQLPEPAFWPTLLVLRT